MAKPTRATQAKRERERSKIEKREEKALERAQKKEQRGQETGGVESDEDPDLAGIVPGPQPMQEY
jgi:hypothetical protein